MKRKSLTVILAGALVLPGNIRIAAVEDRSLILKVLKYSSEPEDSCSVWNRRPCRRRYLRRRIPGQTVNSGNRKERSADSRDSR